MKAPLFLFALTLLWSPLLSTEPQPEAIDFERAKQLFNRLNQGETLSADDAAYLQRAKAERARQAEKAAAPDAAGIDWEKAKELYRREQRGEKLTEEEQQFLNRAKAVRSRSPNPEERARPAAVEQRKAPARLVPLCDMGEGDRYEGEDGGLYGGGENSPPEPQLKAAQEALQQIKPIDGKIVLISISMSNATMEFSAFKKLADLDPRKSEVLTIVDCAQGGQAMAEWADAEGRPWREALNRLERAGVTPSQVQAAWVKLANKSPSGSMKQHLDRLEADTAKVLQNAKRQFPNLRIAYLGSRIWAGNAKSGLNPEPYAYEGAFAVRHLIEQQMKGAPELAADKAPVLLWGPYLWAEGEKGRKIDGLKWAPEDFAADGTHPSERGREKVAKQLLEFFATDPLAKSWFAK